MSDLKDDSTIDLSGLDEVPEEDLDSLRDVSVEREEFKISHLEPLVTPVSSTFDAEEAPQKNELTSIAGNATDKVKVKFDKFITLVATHTYEDILRKNADEEVIVSTNLLTDLANAHEETSGLSKKLPLIFIVGIALGILITYLVLKT